MKAQPIKKLPIVEHFNDSNIKVMALGGLGEVGKNMYVIECSNEIMIIDSGTLFPDFSYGIDYIIPDYSYLIDNESKIIGLFITHGHEDHIGGIPHLLSKVKIPHIYTNGLALNLIKLKLLEFHVNADIIEYNNNSVFNFKNFSVSFFRTNHSIPDSFGIAIKTRLGYIIHTGDFKLDLSPLVYPTDFSKLTRYADSGVLCLISDSTNAKVTKLSLSERKIGESIKSIFSHIKGRIIIATFASNVQRVEQIIKASMENGRKVIVFGRSMEKTVDISQKMKYLNIPEGTLITAKDFPHLPPEKITILSTGSQGEPLAALSRIADGNHKQIKLIEGDTIIFSSSAIPGNQHSINKIINKLYRVGANVIVNSPLTDTHTSGHASEYELKLVLALTKPKYFIPMHGEHSMLKRHSEIAIETGVKKENCFILDNGDVVTFMKDRAFSNYAVKSGDIFVDESGNVVPEILISERRMLADSGLLAVIYTINKRNQLIKNPEIVSRGFIYMKHSENLVHMIERAAYDIYLEYLKTTKQFDRNSLNNFISNGLRKFIDEKTNCKPMIIPILMKA